MAEEKKRARVNDALIAASAQIVSTGSNSALAQKAQAYLDAMLDQHLDPAGSSWSFASGSTS